ncbi:MAG: hypothetical protein DRN26_05875 [Thermoplasmata archaeon]|uniref:Uncharacterized protein n=1 Tax=candidate division Kazan bacterium TaxID=2202143 RepID=A0A420ZBN6_UNCK3|nr:MAG: hypothetical protein DRH29_04550 [candidate division Kazan bacterium]RLF65143.1 MAG: hypothetical protein DRN26_05875 [Thermoplasmata archaeon]
MAQSNIQAAGIRRQIERYIGEGRKCTNCSHLPVCALYQAIVKYLESFPEKPFSPDELAIICKFYKPIVLR